MIKGLHIVGATPAQGPTKWYVYAWRGGPKIMATAGTKPTRLTPEAVEAYRKAIDVHKAWSEDSLTSVFIPIRDKAEVVDDAGDGKHFHDLWGAFATRLMLSGLQDDEIAELMG